MTIIIKQHNKNEFGAINSNDLFKEIDQDLEEIFKEKCEHLHGRNTLDLLQTLLGKSFSNERYVEIIRPWVRAIQLSGIFDKINIPDEREIAKAIIDAAKNLKKYLHPTIPARDKLRYMIESKYKGSNQIINIVNDIIEHESFFTNLCFKNGSKMSPNYFKRYAVYSLFHLGEKLNLKHQGGHSPLFQLVKIITQLSSKVVSEYYVDYKKTSLDKENDSSILLNFIYPAR